MKILFYTFLAFHNLKSEYPPFYEIFQGVCEKYFFIINQIM